MAQIIFSEGSNKPPAPKHAKPQLLVNILDGLAVSRPYALYAEYPVSATTYADGFFKVNYAQFANAVNGMAWWLETNLGHGKNFEPLAYLGPSDIRYNALLLGAVKAGYKMFFTSTRNSIAAHKFLLKSLDCTTFLTSSPTPPIINAIAAAYPLKLLQVPSVQELLERKYPHYPYKKTFEDSKCDPLLVLHTSGSTGMPKPIIWTHEWAAAYQMWSQMDTPDGFEARDKLYGGDRLFPFLPAFHCGGIYATVFAPLFNQTTVIYPLSGAIPSVHGLAEGLKYIKADAALLPPLWIEEICKDPELLEFFSNNLDSIFYAGGDIPQAYGDILYSKMKNFFTIIGSTESGIYPSFMTGSDWKYFQFNEKSGIEFKHQSGDLYEAYIVRSQTFELEQPVFKLFNNLQEYASGDMYRQHPTRPGLWVYIGRSDDIIVFLTGEKTNPVSMEQHIAKHLEVQAALVVGSSRFQAALLVELANKKPLSVVEQASVIELLWPTIQEANAECPAHAKISKSHILIVSPDKPMQRAGKGTIQRRNTIDLYTAELDALYDQTEKTSDNFEEETQSIQERIDIQDSEKVISCICNSVASITGWSEFDNEQNWFIQGMDSLQALSLTRKLGSSLAMPQLALTTLYMNPSVSSLARAISMLAAEDAASKPSAEQPRQDLIENFAKEYRDLLDQVAAKSKANGTISRSNGLSKHANRVVVLTGSTGALGSYLLQFLLETPSVSHIYCLNRTADSELLQVKRNSLRGLRTKFPTARVSFLTSDLSKPLLGLEPKVYTELLANATEIIHNAWPVNFNLSLSTFRPQLSGMVNLIELAAAGDKAPSLLFVSSISSVSACNTESSALPEKIVQESTAPAPMGYAESKHIAELLIDDAAEKLNINASVARVGQLAGPINQSGYWSRAEWLPSLVISSLHIGFLPQTLGSSETKIDWVPIDVLAEVLVELVFTDGNGHARVFHPLNLHLTRWETLLPAVIQSLSAVSKGKTITTVPFETWLQHIRAKAEASTASDQSKLASLLEINPAVKLLPFYEALGVGEKLPSLQTTETAKESEKLRGLEAIKPEWMQSWAKDWFS